MDLPHGKVRAIYGTADEITEFIEQLFQEKSLLEIKWNDECTLSFLWGFTNHLDRKLHLSSLNMF